MHSSLSSHVSKALNAMGYHPSQVRFRQDGYKTRDELMNNGPFRDNTFRCIRVGSKVEGLTNYYESDSDKLFVHKYTLCVENDQSTVQEYKPFLDIPESSLTVFVANYDACYPGYVQMELVKEGAMKDEFSTDLCCEVSTSGKMTLSNNKFCAMFQSEMTTREIENEHTFTAKSQQGPAFPVSKGGSDHDNVFCFRFYCPALLQEWNSMFTTDNEPPSRNQRPAMAACFQRLFCCQASQPWPPEKVRREVMNTFATLVPVGHSESQSKNLEWRICFNAGEVLLMKTLNETQIKLYILLKMTLKEILKPTEKEVTSYMLKNIVFWLAKGNQQNEFEEGTLCAWLMKALEFLKKSIIIGFLQNFMIPNRNLLAGKLNKDTEVHMLAKIDNLLENGPGFVQRLEKINSYGKMSSEVAGEFQAWRDEIEQLHIILGNYRVQFQGQSNTLDEFRELCHGHYLYQSMCRRKYDLVLRMKELLCNNRYASKDDLVNALMPLILF